MSLGAPALALREVTTCIFIEMPRFRVRKSMARKIVSQQQKTYRNTYGSLGGRSEGNGRADKGEGDDGLHFEFNI